MVNEPIKEIYDVVLRDGADFMKSDGGTWIAEMIQAIAYPDNIDSSDYKQKLIFHFGLDTSNRFLALIDEQKAAMRDSLNQEP